MNAGDDHVYPAPVPKLSFSNMHPLKYKALKYLNTSTNHKRDSEEAIQSDYPIMTKNTTKQKRAFKSTHESLYQNTRNIKPLREMTFTFRVKRM